MFVEYWTRRAEEGEFERDTLLGYLAVLPGFLKILLIHTGLQPGGKTHNFEKPF